MPDLLEILGDAGVGDGCPPETAREILREVIAEHPPRKKQIIEAIHHDYLRFPDIPPEFWSSEIFQALVLMGDFNPNLVPEEFMDRGTLLARIAVDSSHLINVQEENMTSEFFQELIEYDPDFTEYFAEVVRAYEMSGNNWLSQKFMGWIMETDPDFIHHCVYTHGKALVKMLDKDLIPEYFMRYPRLFEGSDYRGDIEAVKGAVVGDYRNIRYVLPDAATHEVCKMALVQDRRAIEFISKEMLGEELARIYHQKGGDNWHYFDAKVLSSDFWKMVVEQDGSKINVVPQDKLTQEIKILAVRHHHHNMDYIPVEERDLKTCVESYCNSGSAYEIPESIWNSIDFQLEVINWGDNPHLEEPLPDRDYLKFCIGEELDPLDSFSKWKFNNPSNSKPKKIKVVI